MKSGKKKTKVKETIYAIIIVNLDEDQTNMIMDVLKDNEMVKGFGIKAKVIIP